MNPVPLFLIIVSLPLLLGGCGEKHEGVNAKAIEGREGIAYLKGSDAPYTGKTFILYKNGQKKLESNYKDGKMDGLWMGWHENGQKELEANFNEGKKEGVALAWYDNGQKEVEGNFKNDKKEGLWVQWHENGQKKEESNFKDGKGDGLAVAWHENGEKKGERNYKDGVEISRKYWNSKGEPVDSLEEAVAE